jgi:hypothetical protein
MDQNNLHPAILVALLKHGLDSRGRPLNREPPDVGTKNGSHSKEKSTNPNNTAGDKSLMREAADGPIQQAPLGRFYNLTFQYKLRAMMEAVEKDEALSSVVSWNPDGTALVIKMPRFFSTQVLPRFLRTNKFVSFQRQLNAYGFRRTNLYDGIDGEHIYEHEHFRRDQPELLERMRRRRKSEPRKFSSARLAGTDTSGAAAMPGGFFSLDSGGLDPGAGAQRHVLSAAAVISDDASSTMSRLRDLKPEGIDNMSLGDDKSYSSSSRYSLRMRLLMNWNPDMEQLASSDEISTSDEQEGKHAPGVVLDSVDEYLSED